MTSYACSYTGAIAEFNAPVVIGAAPPADSERAKAQRMFGNGTLDFDGLERIHNVNAAATRIKQRQVAKATAGDPIIIASSSDDGQPRIVPAKKNKTNANQHTKAAAKKGNLFQLDSSDEEANGMADEDTHSTTGIGEPPEEDYQEVGGDSRKRKARKPPQPGRKIKQLAAVLEPSKSKKGKGIKRTYKSAKYVDVTDSDSDSLTVRGTTTNQCFIVSH